MEELFNLYHPVGSIFISFIKQAPKYGEWTLINDANHPFPMTTNNETAGQTGGSYYHNHGTPDQSMTSSNLPSHTHTFYGPGNTSGNPNNAARRKSGSSDPDYWCEGTVSSTSGYIGSTGGGSTTYHNHGNTEDAYYEPNYITVFAFYRIK